MLISEAWRKLWKTRRASQKNFFYLRLHAATDPAAPPWIGRPFSFRTDFKWPIEFQELMRLVTSRDRFACLL